MNKLLLIVIGLWWLGLLPSCYRLNAIDVSLNEIENMMFRYPDSAAIMLGQIEEETCDENQLSRFYLLRSLSDIRNNRQTLSDSVLLHVYDYYSARRMNVQQAWACVGLSYINQSDAELALKWIQQAYDLVETVDDEYKLKYYIHMTWSDLLKLEESSEECIYHVKAAIVCASQVNDTNWVARNMNFLGYIYTKTGDYSRSDSIFDKSASYLTINSHNVGAVQECYKYRALNSYMNDDDSMALKYVNTAIEVSKNYNFPIKPYIYRLKGAIFNSLGMVDSALLYINKPGELITMRQKCVHQLDQARINYNKGRYKVAYDHMLTYARYLDSIYQQDMQKKLMDLRYKYNYAKKERERDIEKLSRQRVTIIGLIVVIGLIALLILSYFVLKSKNRKLAEMIRESHDELERKTLQLMNQSRTMGKLKSRVIENDNVVRKIDSIRKLTDIQLIRSTENVALTDADIENLESVINECDNGLIDLLRNQSPRIGTQDIALCCLLRLNVDKRNLAVLLGISEATLRKRKYRLRTDKLASVHPEIDNLDELLALLAANPN